MFRQVTSYTAGGPNTRSAGTLLYFRKTSSVGANEQNVFLGCLQKGHKKFVWKLVKLLDPTGREWYASAKPPNISSASFDVDVWPLDHQINWSFHALEHIWGIFPPYDVTIHIVLTAKTTVLWRNHVVWAIQLKNRFNDVPWLWHYCPILNFPVTFASLIGASRLFWLLRRIKKNPWTNCAIWSQGRFVFTSLVTEKWTNGRTGWKYYASACQCGLAEA